MEYLEAKGNSEDLSFNSLVMLYFIGFCLKFKMERLQPTIWQLFAMASTIILLHHRYELVQQSKQNFFERSWPMGSENVQPFDLYPRLFCLSC